MFNMSLFGKIILLVKLVKPTLQSLGEGQGKHD